MKTGHWIGRLTGTAMFSLAAAARISSADGTSEWSGISFPLHTCRAFTPESFDARNPVICVTYSNASPDFVCGIWKPGEKWEHVLAVPATTFDGNTALDDYARPDLEERELLPGNWVHLRPGEEVTISYTVSNRYIVPGDWKRMEVDLAHQWQVAQERFVFDRSGKLIETVTLRVQPLDELRRGFWQTRNQRAQAGWTMTPTGAVVVSASSPAWSEVSVPVQSSVASLPFGFDWQNPVVVVTVSNMSADHVLPVWTPKEEWERVVSVPATVFDGKERRSEDYVRLDLEEGPERMPQNWTNLLPGEAIQVYFTVSNRYRIPREWDTMAIDLGSQVQLVDERFVFDRRGGLREVKVLRQRTLDWMKKSTWESRGGKVGTERMEAAGNPLAASTNSQRPSDDRQTLGPPKEGREDLGDFALPRVRTDGTAEGTGWGGRTRVTVWRGMVAGALAVVGLWIGWLWRRRQSR